MKVKLIMVSSVNGRITRGENPDIYRWTSKEDQKFFFDLIHASRLIVMGSGTYDAVRSRLLPFLKGGDHSAVRDFARLRVILTRHPKRYAADARPGQLEFSSAKPAQLVKQLVNRGYKELLLVGGGEVNRYFLQAGLVDEMLITLEPLIFGSGKLMIADGTFNSRLKLKNVKKLNKQGTLLCRYALSKPRK